MFPLLVLAELATMADCLGNTCRHRCVHVYVRLFARKSREYAHVRTACAVRTLCTQVYQRPELQLLQLDHCNLG